MRQRFCNGIIHVIKDNENLYQLSRMYRVPLALIMRANPYIDVYNLQPGMEVCIPTVRRPMPPYGGMRPPAQQGGPNGIPGENGLGNNNQNNDRPPMPPMPPEGPGRPPMPPEGPGRPPMPSDGARMYEDEEPADVSQTEESGEEFVSLVADGARNLGDILSEADITMQEFWECNSPEDIVMAADVTYKLPKKV